MSAAPKSRQPPRQLVLVLALDQRAHQLRLVRALPMGQRAHQVVAVQEAQDRLETSVQIGHDVLSCRVGT